MFSKYSGTSLTLRINQNPGYPEDEGKTIKKNKWEAGGGEEEGLKQVLHTSKLYIRVGSVFWKCFQF